jgi:5S rRNA maturation endonuclease (ribonuclease M5)
MFRLPFLRTIEGTVRDIESLQQKINAAPITTFTEGAIVSRARSISPTQEEKIRKQVTVKIQGLYKLLDKELDTTTDQNMLGLADANVSHGIRRGLQLEYKLGEDKFNKFLAQCAVNGTPIDVAKCDDSLLRVLIRQNVIVLTDAIASNQHASKIVQDLSTKLNNYQTDPSVWLKLSILNIMLSETFMEEVKGYHDDFKSLFNGVLKILLDDQQIKDFCKQLLEMPAHNDGKALTTQQSKALTINLRIDQLLKSGAGDLQESLSNFKSEPQQRDTL